MIYEIPFSTCPRWRRPLHTRGMLLPTLYEDTLLFGICVFIAFAFRPRKSDSNLLPHAPARSPRNTTRSTPNQEAMEKDIFGRCTSPPYFVRCKPASDLSALGSGLPGPSSDGSKVSLISLPIEIKIMIVEQLVSPNERMRGLSIIRRSVLSAHLTREIILSHARSLSVDRGLRHVADRILFARLALGAMRPMQVQHHLSLLEDPLSSRLRNYTTTVSLSLVFAWRRQHYWEEWDEGASRLECSRKDDATASILRLLTGLLQIEIDFPPFYPVRQRETWQWWPKTVAALDELGRAADGTSRPFIRALALHAIRPPMDALLGQILTACLPNLSALVLATSSDHIYKVNDADFVASWTSIQLYATNLATLVVSGVPVTAPNGSWACAQSLRSLDITAAPDLTPTLVYELICQLPALCTVTLRSIRLGFASTPPPKDGVGVSTYTRPSQGVVGSPTTAGSSLNTNTTRARNAISLRNIALSSLDIDFVAALSCFRTNALHLQEIHRSTTLLQLLKQSSAFVGLSRLTVGNEEEMAGPPFGWLDAKETEELKAICKERGWAYEDERFSGTK